MFILFCVQCSVVEEEKHQIIFTFEEQKTEHLTLLQLAVIFMVYNKSIISIQSYQPAFSSLQLKKCVLTNGMHEMALNDKSQENEECSLLHQWLQKLSIMSQDLYLQLDTARSQNSLVHSKKLHFKILSVTSGRVLMKTM